MDNIVGQKNIQNNVEEDEVISFKNEQKDAGERNENVVEGEDSVLDNINSSTATQKDVAVDDQSSIKNSLTKVASVPIDITTSPKNSIDTFHSIPTSTSDHYKSNSSVFNKYEILVTSDSHTHFHYLDTDIDPNNLSEIDEDGMIALQVVEKKSPNPSISPSPNETLLSKTNISNKLALKRIIRIERDYSRGEMCQFRTTFPIEIDGRITPIQFRQTINKLNELLVKAFNPKNNWYDNCLACITIYTTTLFIRPHYEKIIEEICIFLDNENQNLYNINGLNFRDPRKISFLFLELELY